MQIPIAALPQEPEGFTIEPGEKTYIFRFPGGGAARVAVKDGELVFMPKRSAEQRKLIGLLGL